MSQANNFFTNRPIETPLPDWCNHPDELYVDRVDWFGGHPTRVAYVPLEWQTVATIHAAHEAVAARRATEGRVGEAA